jgi:hypothetical protein
VDVFWVFQIKLLGSLNEGPKRFAVEAADPIRIRALLHNDLLPPVEEVGVVLIVPREDWKLAHEFLSGHIGSSEMV